MGTMFSVWFIQIMRLVLNESGVDVQSQSCVVELANTVITNIKVDAVHG